MKTTVSRRLLASATVCGLCLLVTGAIAGPVPVGESTTTISYTSGSGDESYSAPVDYNGESLADAISLVGAPNVWSFNSVNSFGRRTFVAGGGAPVLDTQNESLVAHAMFKGFNDNEYFPGITADSNVTLQVEGVTFDQPVSVDETTVMLHVLWRPSQADALSLPYSNLHDHHIAGDTFRDFDEFFPEVFLDSPVPNYVLSVEELQVSFTGEGTDTLNLEVTFPYSLLANLEEQGQAVPDGLPAPHGFLEPFHFHVEYVVVPEPATLTLLAFGALGLGRRRANRRS